MVVALRSQPGKRRRLDLHRLLDQPVEELASVSGGATVESKGVLVQVVVQVISRDRTLMCAEEPTLQERRHSVHTGEQRRGRPPAPADHPDLVLVPEFLEPLVSLPTVADPRGS